MKSETGIEIKIQGKNIKVINWVHEHSPFDTKIVSKLTSRCNKHGIKIISAALPNRNKTNNINNWFNKFIPQIN